MHKVVLIGLNHKTAPVELRENLSFSTDESAEVLDKLRQVSTIDEVFLLSTCNRTEMIFTTKDEAQALQTVKTFISETKKIPLPEFEGVLYAYNGSDAVRHLFKVAASLDSQVVGEPQILGQIKEAYRLAVGQGSAAVILNRLLHKAFSVAKQVRAETGIGDHAVSISYVAVELGYKIFDAFEEKQVLLIGAGEMAELAVEHLRRRQVEKILVTNRTFENAVRLAQRFNGEAIRIEELDACLSRVDIIISSTGSTDYIVTPQQVKKVMRGRKQRPLFFIDIAVPRDIDPKVHRIDNAYVYDIDDLKGIIEENIQDRRREAIRAEGIVEDAVVRFEDWYQNLDVVPTIVALRKKFEQITESEVEKTLKTMAHLSETDRHAIKCMAESLTNKFLHHPTVRLKANHGQQAKSTFIDAVRKLFMLDE